MRHAAQAQDSSEDKAGQRAKQGNPGTPVCRCVLFFADGDAADEGQEDDVDMPVAAEAHRQPVPAFVQGNNNEEQRGIKRCPQ